MQIWNELRSIKSTFYKDNKKYFGLLSHIKYVLSSSIIDTKSYSSWWKYEPFPTCVSLDVAIRQKVRKKFIFGKEVDDKRLTPVEQAIEIVNCQIPKHLETLNGCKLWVQYG